MYPNRFRLTVRLQPAFRIALRQRTVMVDGVRDLADHSTLVDSEQISSTGLGLALRLPRTGEHPSDRSAHPHQFRRVDAGGQFVTVDDAGHSVALEQPEALSCEPLRQTSNPSRPLLRVCHAGTAASAVLPRRTYLVRWVKYIHAIGYGRFLGPPFRWASSAVRAAAKLDEAMGPGVWLASISAGG